MFTRLDHLEVETMFIFRRLCKWTWISLRHLFVLIMIAHINKKLSCRRGTARRCIC